MGFHIESGAAVQPAFSPASLKVIVFDCDGVLFDSKNANVQFYNHVLERFDQLPVREDQEEYIHMHSAKESLRYLMGDGLLYQEALTYCQGLDFRQFHAYLRREPGLVSLLQSLKPAYKTALATNRTVSTREVLEHFLLDKYFDFVVTAADVRFPKPHPGVMHRVMETFEAQPEEILYIGDSSVDEAVAVATNVYFAAYKNRRLKAHLHISHFEQLSAILFPDKGSA